MSNIKNLFNKGQSNKLVTNSSLSDLGREIESPSFVESHVKQSKKFIPDVNFATASNFSVYGLAEEYYKNSIDYITNEYPYDGSRKEKIDWELSGTYIDKYFFDNLYPRTNGYANIGKEYGTATATAGQWDLRSKIEYIRFDGGPNKSSGYDSTKSISEYFSGSNVYSTGSGQDTNIELDGNKGFTVEFWFKKKQNLPLSNESRKQVICDISNGIPGGLSGRPNQGRLTIFIDRNNRNILQVKVNSGSAGGSSTFEVGGGGTVEYNDNVWRHYAFTFKNNPKNDRLGVKSYVNGVLITDKSGAGIGAKINKITGSMFGYIGALTNDFATGQGGQFYGKLSGSIDEFRFWKTERTEKQIRENWFTQVYGGSNKDYALSVSSSSKFDFSNKVDLGVYFKFNEGIIDTSSINSQDAVVLDYAGRSSNGSWTGYSVNSRETGSAIVLSNAAKSEFKDPIIYSNHPSVSSLRTSYIDQGKLYDAQNNSALYWSLPSWITNGDQSKSNSQLKRLTQIIGSKFDEIQMQVSSVKDVKDRSYKLASSGSKPVPFMSEILRSYGLDNDEILSNATQLEYFASRNETENFENKLSDTKNLIYLNLYNNLVDIYKSKGTEKAFRNLIRCFGVDESIVNINLYGNNVDHELRQNEKYSVIRKKAIDFFDPNRFESSIYLKRHTGGLTDANDYIKFDTLPANVGSTFECGAHFKPNSPVSSVNFLSASIFGAHTYNASGWASPDYGNFQIYSVRKSLSRNEAFFVLTGTAGGFMPELTSSVFKDVYDNSKWNFSLRVYPEEPFVGSVSGSNTSDYTVRFTGYQYVLDDLVNSFDIMSSISNTNAINFLQARKVMFVGAHRTNFVGTVLEKSNAQISSCRVWAKKLENEQLKIHAKDPFNFGVKSPGDNEFISISGSELGKDPNDIPDIKTLAMNWDFETVTGSSPAGSFVVPDYSSGSTANFTYGFLNQITQYNHPGLAVSFPANSTDVVTRKFINSSTQKKPEVINSSNMVSVISETDDELFTRTSRPIDYFFSFEKSMYNVISKDMLNMFATIVDFNNIIGEPVYRYRSEYKNLEKLRQLYFENVDNDPDFEKFLEYYKWIDSSISTMLMQLAPASANFYDGMKNMVESHVLERNKYWNKFPTIEKKMPVSLEANALHAMSQNGNINIIDPIEGIPCGGTLASIELPNGRRETVCIYTDPEAVQIEAQAGASPIWYDGGSNTTNKDKNVDYFKDQLVLGSETTISTPSSELKRQNFDNVRNEALEKDKLNFSIENSQIQDGYGVQSGDRVAPFSMYSSSVNSGYITQIRNNFKPSSLGFSSGVTSSAEITNYHDDSYYKGAIPVQGPFTQEHVGGKQYRHQGIVTTPQSNGDLRGEGWNLNISNNSINVTPRTYSQARATLLRDGTSKKPLNIANIKYNSNSSILGNYSNDYEIFETSGRTTNNRYYVKTEGATLANTSSLYVIDVYEYELPRYNLTGTNKSIIVERFSAPGGPETTGGGLNIHGAEFSVYNTVNYRNLSVRNSLNSWYTEHSNRFGIKSGSTVRADDYNTNPSYHKVNRNPRHVIEENNNCAVIYDNWWIQHPIPQSVFQYSWVTASVSKSACDTFGYVTPFTVPSGITSVTQSAVPFISQGHVNAGGITIDFVGLNTLINDPLNSSSNVLGSSDNNYKNTSLGTISDAEVANSLNLHRNGPYQYPSWKQVRTGETPIPRHHRKNNILSVAPSAQMINLKNGEGPGRDVRYLNTRPDTFKNFTQPPVSFKNKSLVTTVSDLEQNQTTLIHSYGTNKEYFSQPIGNTGSISDYAGFEEPETEQFYDEILDNNEISVLENHYGEIIYPRDGRTGLAQTRTRVNYAETATVTNGSASFSIGSNGIDRGPLLRRSFWRDSEASRNRRIFFEGTSYGPRNGFNASPALSSAVKPDIATTLPNSQGYLDGAATSIYGMGRTPLTFCDTVFSSSEVGAYFAPQSLFPPASGSTATNGYGIFDPASDFLSGKAHMLSFFPDTGELNSANWQTIAGYIGISSGSSTAGSWANQTTLYPTASSYYNHRSKTMGNGQAASLQKFAWRTPELSGKNPWFNSYQDYTQDISKVAQNFTIVPEFKISDHMNYYSEFNFRKNNDKFLILHGANITASAIIEQQPDGKRSFNQQFFNEYSNTDFQQYFGKFSSDLDLGRISLTCNGVKKLLPYMGFYPSHRTLQLSSLFSQSLGPHISGLGWSNGEAISSSYAFSGALAVQSMLQPYYAPGILYNTIKSGIACDWGAYTSSFNQEALTSATDFGIALAEPSNYRIPFESILDPVSNIGIPSNDGDIVTSKLELLYPTYTGLNHPSNGANDTSSRLFSTPRKPYAYLTSESRNKILSSDTYNLYRLGINNFLAEIPNFFLDEQKLKSITSKRQDEISLVSGTAYYMDVTLEKDNNVVMLEDYLNKPNNGQPTSVTQYRTYNGRYFGPPLQGGPSQSELLNTSCSSFYDPIGEFGFLTFFENAGDPLYAQYTPPYFYGKSKATIKYVADADDEKGNFSYKKLFEKAQVTYENAGLNDTLTKLQKRSELIFWVTSSVSGTFECAATADHSGEYFVLSRSTGASSWDVFGATSSVYLPVTSSQYLEWQTLSTNKNYMVGLNNNPPSASTYTDMEYAMQISNDGRVNAWENGTRVYSSNTNTYSLNDWFRIRVSDKNTVFYEICKATSRADSVYPNGNPRVGDTDIGGTGPKTLYKYGDPNAWETLFTSATSSNAYTNLQPDVSMEQISASIAYAQVGTNNRVVYPVERGAMQLSSSLNTFGILTEKQSRFDKNGELIEVVDAPDPNRNRWIISPKMETPVLDFSNQPRIEQEGRGMWSGYGQLLTASNGVTFGVEETFKDGFGAQSGSLVRKCFEAPQLRKVGEIADLKKISEAIVAIPYSSKPYGAKSKYAETTPVLDRNFFRIKTRTFDFYKKWYEANKNGNLSSIPVDKKGNERPSESITKMLSIAGDYVLPPEIDFTTYDSSRTKVNPFAMYIFEFNHYLDAQDLADIWQGVMPKISTNPEFSDPSVDNNVFSHATGKDEFFHGKQLPPDTRWMVFKVKKRAGYNYFEVTPTNSDDEQFNLAFSLGKDNKLKYSFNWPYDFFSLVELAQIQTENTFASDEDQIEEDDN